MRILLSAALLLPALVLSAGEPLTVLTWNIRYQNGHDRMDRWELRREALAKEVLRHRPQVVGLQEALHEQLAYLRAQWPGYGCFGVGRDDGMESGEYAPVLWDITRFALIKGSTVWLSPTPDIPSMGWDATCKRILTIVGLRDLNTMDTVWVANTHWDHEGAEARLHSAHMAVELLKPMMQAGQAVVLMGDLNATQHKAPVRSLAAHFEDAALHHGRRATFNGFERLRLFGRRIDYVWLAPGHWTVDHCLVPHPKVNGRHASDHFPVVAVLRPTIVERSH